MNDKLISFIYSLEKSPKVVSFLLKDGQVVSGKFATPEKPSIVIGRWEYEGLVVLETVTIAQLGKPFAKLPQLQVEIKNITGWAIGKVTAITPSHQHQEK